MGKNKKNKLKKRSRFILPAILLVLSLPATLTLLTALKEMLIGLIFMVMMGLSGIGTTQIIVALLMTLGSAVAGIIGLILLVRRL